MKIVKIGNIDVGSLVNKHSYFKIIGKSKIKKRYLVKFGGVFTEKIHAKLYKLGFYNIKGLIDDFSHYSVEISFEDYKKIYFRGESK